MANRQLTLEDVNAQTELSDHCQSEIASECEDETTEPRTKKELRDRAAAHALEVAQEHFPELPVEDITWQTSTRMKASAGKAIYRPDGDSDDDEVIVRLSWNAYQQYGWEKFARVVRHELIHVWQYHTHGKGGHGWTFEQWVEALDTDRTCEMFEAPKYWVICDSCGMKMPRYKRSKVVQNPEDYRCPDGHSIRIEVAGKI